MAGNRVIGGNIVREGLVGFPKPPEGKGGRQAEDFGERGRSFTSMLPSARASRHSRTLLAQDRARIA